MHDNDTNVDTKKRAMSVVESVVEGNVADAGACKNSICKISVTDGWKNTSAILFCDFILYAI